MAKITINGREFEAPGNMTVLEAAGALGIYIPTLCHNEALGPYGACRLCIVEAEGPMLRRSLMTSCNMVVSEGLRIETDSPLVASSRKIIIELLLARSPGAGPLLDLAARYGINGTRFRSEKVEECVRCGICVRACRDKIGACAIVFAGRGQDRHVTAEFGKLSELCIGCGTCANLCPTKAIRLEDRGGFRVISLWDNIISKLELARCSACGATHTTKKHIEYVLSKLPPGEGANIKDLCPSCARAHYAAALSGESPGY